MKSIHQQWIRGKDPWEKSVRIQKREKRGKTPSRISKQLLENTLGFKEIQSSQVLEV